MQPRPKHDQNQNQMPNIIKAHRRYLISYHSTAQIAIASQHATTTKSITSSVNIPPSVTIQRHAKWPPSASSSTATTPSEHLIDDACIPNTLPLTLRILIFQPHPSHLHPTIPMPRGNPATPVDWHAVVAALGWPESGGGGSGGGHTQSHGHGQSHGHSHSHSHGHAHSDSASSSTGLPSSLQPRSQQDLMSLVGMYTPPQPYHSNPHASSSSTHQPQPHTYGQGSSGQRRVAPAPPGTGSGSGGGSGSGNVSGQASASVSRSHSVTAGATAASTPAPDEDAEDKRVRNTLACEYRRERVERE